MNQPILNSKCNQINAEVIAAWLVDNLAEQLEIEPNEIDKCKPLENYDLTCKLTFNQKKYKFIPQE